MPDWLLFLVLVIATAIGFWQGRHFGQKRNQENSQSLNYQYVKGLNFLLNEEPDAAIKSFIQALDVNSETLETHLALGKLLRKRGEVDRAIRIHQNLLARPGLNKEQSQEAQYELAIDFTKAGLLDRAEGLLKELVSEDGPFKGKGLQRLLEVYRDEKEWEAGLSVLNLLCGIRFGKKYEHWAPVRAHFCCELAEQAIISAEHDKARKWLRKALAYDKKSARAMILSGRLEIASGDTQKGIQQLQKIAEQNPDYLTEALPYLEQGYAQQSNPKPYRDFLFSTYQKNTNPVLVLALTDAIAQQEGEEAAAKFIAREVSEHPSGMGLHKLLDYYLAFADERSKEHLAALQTVMERVITRSPHYQCTYCGFKGQTMHWLCPSCKQWGKIKPVKHVGEQA